MTRLDATSTTCLSSDNAMHVVVVEDAREIAQLLEYVLRGTSATRSTIITSQFESVTDTVDWSEVDAIICDKVLDGVPTQGFDGTTILHWLARNHPHIRRILITADGQVRLEDTFAHVVFRKPFDFNEVLQALKVATDDA